MFDGKAARLRAVLLGRGLSLAVQAVVFWLVLAALGFGLVEGRTWAVLHGVVALGLLALRTAPCPASRWRAKTWLVIAFYAAFLAAFFAGANFALDALHGVNRRRAEIGLDLEGLALWQFLCPGVFSLAVGALADCFCTRPSRVWPNLRSDHFDRHS